MADSHYREKGIVAACVVCGGDFTKNSPTHKYCAECSTIRDLERKKFWARENPQDGEYIRKKALQQQSKLYQQGAEISNENRSSIMWIVEPLPEMLWTIRICVPFSYAHSKNHMFTQTRNGHVALRADSRAARDEITLKLRESINNSSLIKPVPAKMWLDILVQKTNHRGDAVNVVDLVCDAVKDATDVDDRWYSIRRIDWEIVKVDPKIYIGISQSTDIPHQVCSMCGRILPYSEFGANRSRDIGISRECKICKQVRPENRKHKKEFKN